MMTGLGVAIIGSLLAWLIQAASIERRRGRLRAKEQCFKFHELRDRLQLLAIEGKLSPDSPVYTVLLHIINLSIRNAGVIKLSELLRISRAMKQEVESNLFREVQVELLHSRAREVVVLASEVFDTFAKMLVANDDFTYLIFRVLESTTKLANTAALRIVGSVRRLLFNVLKFIIQATSPNRAAVVREARAYKRLAASF